MADQRPNLLFFMPETLRADAIYGEAATRAQTPVLDRLAGEGTAFTNCFAQVSYCAPSRCSMFTGHYPHTCGHRPLTHLLQAPERNLFRDLKEAGYVTAAYGKNDLLAQDAIPLAFDEVALRLKPDGQPASGKDAPPPPPLDPKWSNCFYGGPRQGEDVHDNDWACIQSALSFLDEDRDAPFCIFLPLSFAHPTYTVEEPYFSQHDRSRMPIIPPVPEGKRPHIDEFRRYYGCDKLNEADLREIKATYFGMVSRLDVQLGLLLDKLRERGLYDNTVTAVFSDHGDYAGDYGMVEKFPNGFEECLLRVPLTIAGLGITAGQELSGLCEMTDFYATIMDLVGLEPGHTQFGASLAPALRGAGLAERDAVFAEGGFHACEPQFFKPISLGSTYGDRRKVMTDHPTMSRKAIMIRTTAWKYVYSPAGAEELYDRTTDPDEVVNLAANPEHAAVRADLRERILKWLLDTDSAIPHEFDPRGWH